MTRRNLPIDRFCRPVNQSTPWLSRALPKCGCVNQLVARKLPERLESEAERLSTSVPGRCHLDPFSQNSRAVFSQAVSHQPHVAAQLGGERRYSLKLA